MQPSSPTPVPRKVTYQQIDEILMNGDQLERFFDRFAVEYIFGFGNGRPVKTSGKHGLRELFLASPYVLMTTSDDNSPGRSLFINRMSSFTY